MPRPGGIAHVRHRAKKLAHFDQRVNVKSGHVVPGPSVAIRRCWTIMPGRAEIGK